MLPRYPARQHPPVGPSARPLRVLAETLELLPRQCRELWPVASRWRLPRPYWQTTAVVVCGMGGSTLGTDVLTSVFAPKLRRPVVVVRDYDVPGFVGPRTLFFAVSYSGETAEPIAALRAALAAGARCCVLSSGGTLAAFARARRIPCFTFQATANPSGQPRFGLGYTLLGQWALLAQAHVLPPVQPRLAQFTAAISVGGRRCHPTVPLARNPAKRLAAAMARRGTLVVVPPPLMGSAHAFANQCHEASKHLVWWAVLPELNHHLLEGLHFPPPLVERLLAVFWESPGSGRALRDQTEGARRIFARAGIPIVRQPLPAGTPLQQAGWLLSYGAYASYYLAERHRVDPVAIPAVDYLKAFLRRTQAR